MKHLHLVFYFLCIVCTLSACTKPTPEDTESCFDLCSNIFQEGNYTYSSWHNYQWIVMPAEKYAFEVFTFKDYDTLFFNDIYTALVNELGLPYANRDTLSHPFDSTLMNTVVYALPNNREIEPQENIYWWRSGSVIVRLFTAPGYEDVQLPSMAVLSFYNGEALGD